MLLLLSMQIPYRKPGKFSQIAVDPLMTTAKLNELKKELEKLKYIRPRAAADVAQLAELGDFSENAEYQLAKGRLRRINNAILRLEREVNNAEIISVDKDVYVVQLGHTVTVECEGKQKVFQILGSSETDPSRGIISQHSALGSALLGHKIGETVKVQLASRGVEYKIIAVK